MIRIPEDIVNKIFIHAERDKPIEACGYLLGLENKVSLMFPMKNMDESRTHFTLDPMEQFKVLNEARNLGLKIIGVYHSHPDTPARPSEEDIQLANDPSISYIIASLLDKSIESFKIQNKKVEKEELEITK